MGPRAVEDHAIAIGGELGQPRCGRAPVAIDADVIGAQGIDGEKDDVGLAGSASADGKSSPVLIGCVVASCWLQFSSMPLSGQSNAPG